MGGGFEDAEVVQPGQATQFYTSVSGLNFGGRCTAPGCAAAGQSVSHCEGAYNGGPYSVDAKCPACQQTFAPGWMWFTNCNVSITKYEQETVHENFTCAGGEIRQVDLKLDPTTLQYSYTGTASDLAVTPM